MSYVFYTNKQGKRRTYNCWKIQEVVFSDVKGTYRRKKNMINRPFKLKLNSVHHLSPHTQRSSRNRTKHTNKKQHNKRVGLHKRANAPASRASRRPIIYNFAVETHWPMLCCARSMQREQHSPLKVWYIYSF